MQRIYLSPPHMSGNEIKFVQEAFDSNWIAPLGPNVDGFEKEICQYVQVNHGLALSSGTSGIHLALRYFGVGPGDYVFCSSLTFSGSCNPIKYQFANPVFIDSEPDTWNMSPKALVEAFEWAKKTCNMPKAVIIVDLYGQSADYDSLLQICNHYGVPVIEDAAEAIGSTFKGKKCGSFGNVGIFSFNGNKIMTTSGGGMVVTNDEDMINKMRFWSTQAREATRHYEHRDFGYNYRMSNICAGIGLGQLMVLDDHILLRKAIRQRYIEELKDLPVKFMPISDAGKPNYWLTVITLDEDSSLSTEEIIDALEASNIESRPVWKPMHLQPIFKECPFFPHLDNKKSVGEELFKRGICLPTGSAMTNNELERVIDSLKKIFNRVKI